MFFSSSYCKVSFRLADCLPDTICQASVKFYTVAAAACIDLEGQQVTLRLDILLLSPLSCSRHFPCTVDDSQLAKWCAGKKNRKIRVEKDKTILLREIANQNREIGRLGLFCYISGRSPDKSGDLAALPSTWKVQ